MEHIPAYYTPQTNFLSMNVRSRREISTRDAANLRRVELWQTDAPFLQMNRPDLGAAPILLDMNPTNSRSLDNKGYLQNKPMTAGQDSFTQNPYFEGYAPQFDSRNAVRELRSAIHEDNFDKGVRESRQLLSRTFTTQWLEPTHIKDKNLDTLNSLEAYEQLKPQMDDIARSFRKGPASSVGQKKESP